MAAKAAKSMTSLKQMGRRADGEKVALLSGESNSDDDSEEYEAVDCGCSWLCVVGRGLQLSTFQLNLSRSCHCQRDTNQRVSQKVLTLS
jgi:hypothetical protein